MTEDNWAELREMAKEAAAHAHAPYSGLQVGAAARTDSGRIVTGCNVENASYGLTLCAECGVVADLHRGGGGRLVETVAVDAEGNVLAPCGRCRQLLFEAGGLDLVVEMPDGLHPMSEVLPGAFHAGHLPGA